MAVLPAGRGFVTSDTTTNAIASSVKVPGAQLTGTTVTGALSGTSLTLTYPDGTTSTVDLSSLSTTSTITPAVLDSGF